MADGYSLQFKNFSNTEIWNVFGSGLVVEDFYQIVNNLDDLDSVCEQCQTLKEQLPFYKKYNTLFFANTFNPTKISISQEAFLVKILADVFPNNRCVVLSGHHDLFFEQYTNLFYFPECYYRFKLEYTHEQVTHARSNKKYRFSCLNGNVKSYRTQLMKGLLSHGALNEQKKDVFAVRYDNQHLLSSSHGTGNYGVEQDVGITHPAWQALCNIVTETDIGQDFITEKTWKPITCGCMFVLVSSHQSSIFLRRLGFEIDFFPDIPDNKKLIGNDNLPQEYIDSIVNLCDCYDFDHLLEVWNQNLDAIKHNYQLFESRPFDKYVTDCVE